MNESRFRWFERQAATLQGRSLMARIVLATRTHTGRMNVAAAVTKRLSAAGHELFLVSPQDIPEWRAEGATTLDFGAQSGRGQSLERRLEALRLDEFSHAVDQVSPDLALVDLELPAYVIAASRVAPRLATWTTMLSVWRAPGLPPLGSSTWPGRGLSGSRAGIGLAWSRFRLWKRQMAFRQRIKQRGGDELSLVRAVARSTGFPADELLTSHWLVPTVFRSIPALEMNAIEIEFPHQPRPHVKYVGPVLDPTRDDQVGREDQERLQEVFEARREGRFSALIYVSFGSWHRGDDRGLISRVAKAISRREDWLAVVTLGGRFTQDAVDGFAGNVRVFSQVPQMQVLAHVDLAIHHAGASTINECVANGVPMIVYPFDSLDRPGGAARVGYWGLGETRERKSDTIDVIEKRIEAALADEGMRQRVDDMSLVFDSYLEQRVLERTVENLIATT